MAQRAEKKARKAEERAKKAEEKLRRGTSRKRPAPDDEDAGDGVADGDGEMRFMQSNQSSTRRGVRPPARFRSEGDK